MTGDFAYDPVTAVDEAKATGETAVLFAEIRQTMRIPLVTSIWRGLAGMDDSLRLAWAAAKPIYKSGEPERALTRSVAAVGLPRPEPWAPTALGFVGLTESDIIAARAVIAAYNRSNGLSRTRGEREPGAMLWHQVLAGRIAGFGGGALYGVQYSDMCAFRAISREALERLALQDMTYGWNIEMQMKAARAGLRILEVPLPYRRRRGGCSKVAGSLRGTLRAGSRIAATFCRVAASVR
jgi:hypothetical protein